jgi:hypothetical protein
VADRCDRLSAALDRRQQPFRRCTRSEAFVDLGFAPGRARHGVSGLPRPQQWTRQDELRRQPSREPLAELAGLLLADGSQPAQLVRLPRRGFGVANQVQAHIGQDTDERRSGREAGLRSWVRIAVNPRSRSP